MLNIIEKRKILFILLLLVTLMQFAVDLYLPSLPNIATDLQSPVSSIKLTIPLYLFGVGISQLFYGPLSDFLGRKPILYFGLILFLLGSTGCFLSQSGMMLIAFRTLQGIGGGASSFSARTIMRDIFHGKQMAKASALISVAWAITPIVAPVIGGYIQSYIGWRANFAAMFLYAGFSWLLIIFVLPETLDKKHVQLLRIRNSLKIYKNLFTNKVFISFSLMSSFCFGYFLSYATASPFLFQTELGFTPIEYGWILLFIAFGTVLGSMICSKIIIYLKLTTVLLIGGICMLLGTLTLFLLAWAGIFNVYSVLIPFFFGSIGGGLIFPNCTTGAMTPFKKNAGYAGAFFGFIQMFNAFVFTTITSKIPTTTAFPLSIELLCISLLILILFFSYIRPHFIEETEDASSS